MSSIGVVCHFWNEHFALPGFLENVSQFFDDVTLVDCGPGGKRSSDGSIEIVEKFGAKLLFDSIDDGYGAVRSRMIRLSSTTWTMLLDADERFLPLAPALRCLGTEAYPEFANPNLSVENVGQCIPQGQMLREQCKRTDIDAIGTNRRHWFSPSWSKPTQNWHLIPDWQLRTMRNCDYVVYRPEVRMHERCENTRTGAEPAHEKAHNEIGPFFEHLNCHFKRMEVSQRKHDIAIFDALHEGRTPPTEFIDDDSPLKSFHSPMP